MYILPYKMASASAKALADELGIRRIRSEGSRFRGKEDKVVINWGCSEVSEEVSKCTIINPPHKVALASDKLKFFQQVIDYNDELYDSDDDVNYSDLVNIPDFTSSFRVAKSWVCAGRVVVERHKLTGNSGEGIRISECVEDLQEAPLYVQYIPKKQEYRVHVAGGRVVDLQRKARRHDVPDEDINWRVRNHDNGFIFQRNDLAVPPQVSEQAIAACKTCELDFGAVDIIYNERQQKAYVLEINTAPGLTGQTLEGYVNRFKNWGVPAEDAQPAPQAVGLDGLQRAPVVHQPMVGIFRNLEV